MKNYRMAVITAALISGPAIADQVCSSQMNSSTAGRFTVNLDGTATDSLTEMVWQRCPVGFELVDNETPDYVWDDECERTPDADRYNWPDAFQFVADGWRLPTVKEFMSIIEFRCYDPALDLGVFPEVQWRRYWTSTAYRNINEAASVDTLSGVNRTDSKQNALNLVQLVRQQ